MIYLHGSSQFAIPELTGLSQNCCCKDIFHIILILSPVELHPD